MKTVFKTQDVANTFVQQTQGRGRTPNNSFYFEGNELFSYGSHFMVCKIIGNTAIVAMDNPSPTTGRHISMVINALGDTDYKVIRVPLLENDMVFNVVVLRARIADTELEQMRSRKYKDLIGERLVMMNANLAAYLKFTDYDARMAT